MANNPELNSTTPGYQLQCNPGLNYHPATNLKDEANGVVQQMHQVIEQLIAARTNALVERDAFEQRLKQELQTGAMRDEFISILGHDLRNPLQATISGSKMLMDLPLDKTAYQIASIINHSSVRMNALVENVLDFARGRFGNGMHLDLRPEEDIAGLLQLIILEFMTVCPYREVNLDCSVRHPVILDANRLAQLVSNLLGNALQYGDAAEPIEVCACMTENDFVLSIGNHGPDIPQDVKERLFLPFSRGKINENKTGLGLGLYICSLIAGAHKGTMQVHSSGNYTEFILRIPQG